MSESPSTGRIPDWDGLGFGIVETDQVYLARGQLGQEPVWDPGAYAPWAPVLDGVEVFCTGTGWTVRSVREIEHRERIRRFESNELQRTLLTWLQQVQRGEGEDDFGWTTEVPR